VRDPSPPLTATGLGNQPARRIVLLYHSYNYVNYLDSIEGHSLPKILPLLELHLSFG
jgi:hypothetical protein